MTLHKSYASAQSGNPDHSHPCFKKALYIQVLFKPVSTLFGIEKVI